jgi:hypothetical protein
MASNSSPSPFTIESRPVKLPANERARRLAAAYAVLLDAAHQVGKNGDTADGVPVTAVSKVRK